MALASIIESDRSTIQLITVFILTISISYIFVTTIYNLYFHPLRRFPGPRRAAAGRWYYDYLTARGQQAARTKEWHDKYGEIVRLAPNQLSFTNERAWKDIYMHQQDRKQMQKLPFMPILQKAPDLLFAQDDAVHARQRRMVSHAFSDRNLREQEPMIKSYVDLLMSNFADDARRGVSTDVVQEFNFCTFDIIGDFAFGESFHMLESRRPHLFITQLFSGAKIITVMMAISRSLDLMTPLGYFLRAAREKARFNPEAFVHAKVSSRIEAGELQRPDLFTGILKAKAEYGDMMPRDEIDGVASVLLGAGSETTATLMSALTFNLLKHPEWLAKVTTEVRNEFKTVEDITILRVNSRLPLLQAVVEEALRIQPPVPAVFPRVTPPEGAMICGEHVIGNIVVGVPFVAAHHSESNFHRAMEFRPERWLANAPAAFKNDHKAAHAPFSNGPRNCVGKNLAWAEIRMMAARMLFQFDLELTGSKTWSDQRVFTIWEKSPLMVKLTDRMMKSG